MKRSAGALSREIRRNTVNGEYDPGKADGKARVRRSRGRFLGMKITAHPELRAYAEKLLAAGHSPEAISGRLKHADTHLPYVSAFCIRRYAETPYGRKFGKPKKGRRGGKRGKFVNDPGRRSIHERPRYIEHRTRIGDFEVDFIVSGKGGSGRLMVAVDRRTRMVFLELIPEPSVKAVHAALLRIRKRCGCMKSITVDNDILFRKFREMETMLGVPVYFCDPYCSWQKGAVENTNKNIREYIPKGTDLSKITKKRIREIERKLNDRIMKALDYRTPAEVWAEECGGCV